MGDFCEEDPADCSVGPEYRSTLNDCQRYIRCVNGIPFENSCSNFTYFDPQTYACNHEFLVEPKCIAGWKPLTTQAATPTSTTAELTGIAATTSKPTTVSVGSEPTQTSTIPPTSVYDACASRPCQNGGTCVTQANDTFVCQCPSSCVCVDMGEFCEYDPFDCSTGNEFRSHPDNCQLYIRCVHSLPNFLTCANGTIYDPQYASCNFPFLVEPKCEAGWSEDTTPVASATTTVLVSTPVVTSSQPTVSEGSVPTQTTTLPATTLFDPCACQNGGTCLPQANDTFTCECPDVCNCVNVGIFCEYDPDPFDCTSPGEYRSHPDDCQLYIRCVNNNPGVLSCGNGTYYDPQINGCNFPYVVEDKCLNGWAEPGGPDITQSGPDTTQGGPDTTQGGPDTT